MKSDHPLCIALALHDEKTPYLALTAAMGRSLLDNLDFQGPVTFFIPYAGLSPETREGLEASWSDPRLSVQWIESSQVLEPYLHMPTRGTLLRLMLGELLPDHIERVIWLDVDILVLEDLTALWQTDMAGHTLGAVPDPFAVVEYEAHQKLQAAAQKKDLPYRDDHHYFNAGVLLIDLARWRQEGAGAKTLALIDDFPGHFKLLDQDVLNLVFCGRTLYLNACWNIMEPPAFFFEWDRSLYRGLDAEAGIISPSVRHMAGNNKPWDLVVRRTERERFFYYVDRTHWTGWRPDSKPNLLWRQVQDWLDFHWLTVRAFWWPRYPELVSLWWRTLSRRPHYTLISAFYFLRRMALLLKKHLGLSLER